MIYLILLFLTACSAANFDDLRAEGEGETRYLAQILRTVDTKEDLQKQLPKIRKSYLRLVEVLLAVRKLEDVPAGTDPSSASEELFCELARLYEMPGCRELIEGAQQEALQKLR